jgi:hypothetical protein
MISKVFKIFVFTCVFTSLAMGLSLRGHSLRSENH